MKFYPYAILLLSVSTAMCQFWELDTNVNEKTLTLRFTSSTGSHGVGNNEIVIVKPQPNPPPAPQKIPLDQESTKHCFEKNNKNDGSPC